MKRIFIALAAASFNQPRGNRRRVWRIRESKVQGKFGKLDHVFLIIMENQTNTDILGNVSAPFINSYAKVANQGTNYYAVGHPSAPNYLEIVGGSNFGLSNDFWPVWVNGGCVDNAPGSTGCVNAFTPIAVAGFDNAVVATATNSTQCNGQVTITGSPVPNNCALRNYPAMYFTPKSIADQLVAKNKTCKAYQESLPTVAPGVAGINYSDGAYSNLSPASVFAPGPISETLRGEARSVRLLSEYRTRRKRRSEPRTGQGFRWAGWAMGQPANRGRKLFVHRPQPVSRHAWLRLRRTPICSAATPAESALLMAQGDAEVEKLVTGIKASPAWSKGRNVIILVWDENDFSNAVNKVVFLVETNYAPNGHVVSTPYDHFSLLRTLEAGFGLPCLNHACDATSHVMDDLFGG